jgi:putative thioredoxin
MQVLNGIPDGIRERTVADTLLATIEFRKFAANQHEPDLRAKIEADPGDSASRYALGSLLVTEERFLEALEEFLEIVRRDRTFNDDGARKAMLALFIIIGEDQDVTKTYRQKLANVLF